MQKINRFPPRFPFFVNINLGCPFKKSHKNSQDIIKSLCANFLHIQRKLCTLGFSNRNIFEAVTFLTKFLFYQELAIFYFYVNILKNNYYLLYICILYRKTKITLSFQTICSNLHHYCIIQKALKLKTWTKKYAHYIEYLLRLQIESKSFYFQVYVMLIPFLYWSNATKIVKQFICICLVAYLWINRKLKKDVKYYSAKRYFFLPYILVFEAKNCLLYFI